MSEVRNKYQWTGITSKGARESGVIQAVDMKNAQSELRRIGVEVISLQPKKKSFVGMGSGISVFRKKVKRKDILLFTRYLSTMLSAGLPVVQALDIIATEQTNPAMQNLIMTLRKNIASGKTLSESFGEFPQYFSELYCSLIKAGEKSGTLDKILLRLGNYLEKTENLRRKIKKALVYPTAILCVAFIVSLILLIFVVPKFQSMFDTFGAKLPMFTLMVVNLSNFVRSYWWLLLLVIIGGIFGLRYALRKSKRLKNIKDHYMLKIFIIGPVLKKGIIARYTRTLSTTLEAGMPIVEGMKSMAPIMGNQEYMDAVVDICRDVTNGHQLSQAMSATKIFPSMAVQMIAVGEASGSLATMLNKVADHYEEEVNTIVDNLSSLLEPLIMLILGVIVGGFVIAMYLPIFRMGSLF